MFGSINEKAAQSWPSFHMLAMLKKCRGVECILFGDLGPLAGHEEHDRHHDRTEGGRECSPVSETEVGADGG